MFQNWISPQNISSPAEFGIVYRGYGSVGGEYRAAIYFACYITGRVTKPAFLQCLIFVKISNWSIFQKEWLFFQNILTKRAFSSIILMLHRGIAQLVEYWSPKPWVVGSSPSAPANKKRTFVYRQRCVFWMMFAYGKWCWLCQWWRLCLMTCAWRHIGQTSHHCET